MSFRERYLNRTMQLEFAPVVVFFVVHWFWGLMAATAAAMVATVICVGIGWATVRRIPVFGIVTVVLALGMGGMTLVLDDATFVEVQPTVGKVLFAAVLLVGMYLHPTMLERALGSFVILTDRGWRVLHWRWIGLALGWAVANEIARRVLSTDDWVTFVTAMSVASIVSYVLATRYTAPAYWAGPRDD